MSRILKQLVIHKLRNLTTEELLTYAEDYNFPLDENEAEEIIDYFKGNSFDPFNLSEINNFFYHLEEITTKSTAGKAKHLFHSLIDQYNLSHLFFE